MSFGAGVDGSIPVFLAIDFAGGLTWLSQSGTASWTEWDGMGDPRRAAFGFEGLIDCWTERDNGRMAPHGDHHHLGIDRSLQLRDRKFCGSLIL